MTDVGCDSAPEILSIQLMLKLFLVEFPKERQMGMAFTVNQALTSGLGL